MSFGWKPGFRREKWLHEHRKKTWAGHSLPGLESQAPLHSSADSAAALLWWRCLALQTQEGAMLLPHLLAVFWNAGHTWSEAGFLIPQNSTLLPLLWKAKCGPENSPICQCISHLVLPFLTVSKPLWFCVVQRTRNCGMSEWEILCDVNCWDSSLSVSVFLSTCYSVMFLLRGTVCATWNPSLWNPPFMKSIFSLLILFYFIDVYTSIQKRVYIVCLHAYLYVCCMHIHICVGMCVEVQVHLKTRHLP